MSPAWEVRLMGETAAVAGPEGIWRPSLRQTWLLAYLALEGPTSRDRLAGLIWPDQRQPRARANLRQTLYRLRRKLPLADGDTVALAAGTGVDVEHFDPHASAHARAPGLLSAVQPIDAPELELWLEGRRIAFRSLWREGVHRRLDHARAAGHLGEALLLAQHLMNDDPWSEAAARQVMELALERSDPASALVAFRQLRASLEKDLGVPPSPDTVAVAHRATRAAVGGLRREARADAARLDGRNLARDAETRGWLAEGAALLRARLDASTEAPAIGRLLIDLAWLEHRQGHRKSAIIALDRGLETLSAAGASDGVADAHFLAGTVAWADGDLASARSEWTVALGSLPALEADTEPTLRFNLALVEDALGHPELARVHYLAGLPDAQARGDLATVANILNNLGEQCVTEGRVEAGRALLRRARALAVRCGARPLEGYALDGLARAELAIAGVSMVCDTWQWDRAPNAGAHAERTAADLVAGPVDQAIATASSAWTVAREVHDVHLEITSSLTLATAYAAAGRSEDAIRFALHALRLARRTGWSASLRRALWFLAELTGPRDALSRRTLAALQSEEAADRIVVPNVGRESLRSSSPLPPSLAALASAWTEASPTLPTTTPV